MNFGWKKKKKKTNIAYFHAFRCKYFILNNRKKNLAKFYSKSNERIFVVLYHKQNLRVMQQKNPHN